MEYDYNTAAEDIHVLVTRGAETTADSHDEPNIAAIIFAAGDTFDLDFGFTGAVPEEPAA